MDINALKMVIFTMKIGLNASSPLKSINTVFLFYSWYLPNLGAVHYYTFLSDPTSCPYIITFQLARSNHEYLGLTFSFDNPYPNPYDTSTHYYSTLSEHARVGPNSISVPCDYPRTIYFSTFLYITVYPVALYRCAMISPSLISRLSIKTTHVPSLVPVSEVRTPIYAYQLQVRELLHLLSLHRRWAWNFIVKMIKEIPCLYANVVLTTPSIGLPKDRHAGIYFPSTSLICFRFYFQAVLPTEEEISKFFPPPTQASDAQYKLWGSFPIRE